MKYYIIILIILLISIPCAAQWKDAGVNPAQILVFGAHDTNFFASWPGHVYRWLPNGSINQHWIRADTGIDFTQGNITSFASLGRYLFANEQSQYATTYQTSDNGSSWREIRATGVQSNGYYLFGTTTHPFSGQPPYLALSRDSGLSWDSVAIFNNGSWDVTFATIRTCIFANTGNAIWRSLDTGHHWLQISPTFVGTMTIMDSLIYITNNGSVIKSKDNGSNWIAVPVDSGSVQESVNCLATDGKNLFAGTTHGVFISTDSGATWAVKNEGLPGIFNVVTIGVFDTLLFVDVSPGYYAFMRPIPEMVPKSAVQSVSQPPADTIDVFPNPATGLVTIRSGGVPIEQVSVINLLGIDLLDLPNVRQSDITLDISKLPSGTYLFRIKTASGYKLRKIVKEE